MMFVVATVLGVAAIVAAALVARGIRKWCEDMEEDW